MSDWVMFTEPNGCQRMILKADVRELVSTPDGACIHVRREFVTASFYTKESFADIAAMLRGAKAVAAESAGTGFVPGLGKGPYVICRKRRNKPRPEYLLAHWSGKHWLTGLKRYDRALRFDSVPDDGSCVNDPLFTFLGWQAIAGASYSVTTLAYE